MKRMTNLLRQPIDLVRAEYEHLGDPHVALSARRVLAPVSATSLIFPLATSRSASDLREGDESGNSN
jgi:hypothetical protein